MGFLFFLYHSPKDSLGGSGISLSLNHGLRLLFTTKGTFLINHLPILPADLYIAGCDKVKVIPFMLISFALPVYPSLPSTCRHLYNCSWILIFTGHTLLQLPQSVEAKGKSANCFISKLGANIEP